MNFQKVYSLVSLQELLIPLEQTVCLQNWKAHFSKGYILPLSSLPSGTLVHSTLDDL